MTLQNVSEANAAQSRIAHQMTWWNEARFGMFIHWGPVSLVGTEIGWSRGGVARGVGSKGEVPRRVYDHLYKRFNPTKFKARQWVEIAQAAGMKYLVFTTKHHDGFCMFDSKLTNYKITCSPFGRDITGELAAACHEAGLPLGFYYSPVDWYHPDYRTDNHRRYLRYFHGQLEELCSRYGKVDVLWFDAGGTPQDWDAENLFKKIRRLQPDVIINNRCGLPGDFDTPEQRIGTAQTHRPWESCITIGTSWSFKPRERLKSLEKCIRTLVGCAGGDGNLLLNVGPMPDGRIHPRQEARLREIGEWLARYGQTIYATHGWPFSSSHWKQVTCRGNKLYFHCFQPARKSIILPVMDQKLVGSEVLTGGKARVRQMAGGIEVAFPRRSRDPLDTILELRFDGPINPSLTGA